MNVNKWTLGLAAAGLVTLPTLVRAEEKLSPVLTALSSTTISGYVDTSAHWDLGTGNANPAPIIYNQGKQDGFNLNRVKLRVEKPLDEAQWSAGYRVDLWFGPDANVLGTQVGAASDFAIQQAYAALRAPIGNGLDFKVGVFDSIIGYESHDSVNNPNYTRSYATGLEPRTHTGVLATYQVFDALGLAAGVANTLGPTINNRAATAGANQAETRKTYMGSIALTVPDSLGFLAGSTLYAGIVDGFGNDGNEDQSNYYVGATLNTPLTGFKVGAAFDYVANLSPTPPRNLTPAAPRTNLGDGHAYSAYASYQATEKLSFHARGEYADTWPGLYNSNLALASAFGRTKFNVLALTGTLQYDLWKNVLTRLEFRWDHSAGDTLLFGGTTAGTPTRDNAYLLAANVIYKF
jgi:hypothetical protein